MREIARKIVAVAAVGGFIVASATIASVTVSSATAQSPTVASIFKATSAAMRAKGTYSYGGAVTVSGARLSSVSNFGGKSAGTQTLVIESGVGDLRLVGTKLFLHADAAFFANYFNISKSPLVNKWVLIPTTNPNYTTMSEGITMASVITSVVDLKGATLKGQITLGGHKVWVITGGEVVGNPPAGSTQTDYIASTGVTLPQKIQLSAKVDGETVVSSLTFHRWGVAVKVSPPPTYVTATTKDLPKAPGS